MFERFTDRSRRAMALASEEAYRLNSDYIRAEHVLLGLAKGEPGVGREVLRQLNIEVADIRREVEAEIASRANTPGEREPESSKPADRAAPGAKNVIRLAIEEARGFNHSYVGTEHLVLGLLRHEDGLAAKVLTRLGVDIRAARHAVTDILGVGPYCHDDAEKDASWLLETYKDDPRVGRLLQCIDLFYARRKKALDAGRNEDADRLADLMHDASRAIEDLYWKLKDESETERPNDS